MSLLVGWEVGIVIGSEVFWMGNLFLFEGFVLMNLFGFIFLMIVCFLLMLEVKLSFLSFVLMECKFFIFFDMKILCGCWFFLVNV